MSLYVYACVTKKVSICVDKHESVCLCMCHKMNDV